MAHKFNREEAVFPWLSWFLKYKAEKRESMNHVFISGIVEKAPVMVSKESEIPHVTLELTVTHINTSGKEKREKYPLRNYRKITCAYYNNVIYCQYGQEIIRAH